MHVSECAMRHLLKSNCVRYYWDMSETVGMGDENSLYLNLTSIKAQDEKGIFSIDGRYSHLMDTTTILEPMQNWQWEALLWNNNFMGHYELTSAYKIWYPQLNFGWILCQKFSLHVPKCEILQAALKEKWKQKLYIYMCVYTHIYSLTE